MAKPPPKEPQRPLVLKRVDGGHVRQSFAGRSKKVVVVEKPRRPTMRSNVAEAMRLEMAKKVGGEHFDWADARAANTVDLLLRALTLAVVQAQDAPFSLLVRLADLNPYRGLRFANLDGIDFKGSDLTYFDFTGASLVGCKFSGSRIAFAAFEGANLLSANLSDADDWADYVANWQKPSRPVGTAHLPAGAVFKDAPLGPEMVVLPAGGMECDRDGFCWLEGSGDRPTPRYRFFDSGCLPFSVTFADRFAVSRELVDESLWNEYKVDGGSDRSPLHLLHRAAQMMDGRPVEPAVADVNWHQANDFTRWCAEKFSSPYRLPSETEWIYRELQADSGLLEALEGESTNRIDEWCSDDERDVVRDTPVSDGSPWVDETALRKVVCGPVGEEHWLRRQESRPPPATSRSFMAPYMGDNRVGFRVVRDMAKSDAIGQKQAEAAVKAALRSARWKG